MEKKYHNHQLLYFAIVFVCLSGLLSCVDGGGAAPGSVSGAVGMAGGLVGDIATSGPPSSLANVQISVIDSDNTIVYTTVSNSSGVFSIPDGEIPYGEYTFVPSKDRCVITPEHVVDVISQNSALNLNFTVTPIPYIKGHISNTMGIDLFGVRVQVNSQGVVVNPGGVSVTIGDGVSINVGDTDGNGLSINTTDANGDFAFYTLPANTQNFDLSIQVGEATYTPVVVDALSDPMIINFEVNTDNKVLPMTLMSPDIGQEPSFPSRIVTSFDGKTLVVTSSEYDSTIADWDEGTAWVYRLDGVQLTRDRLKPSKFTRMFGNGCAISDDGDSIVIGAYGTDDSRGSVHVFDWNGDHWGDTRLLSDIRDGYYYYGEAVSISADGNTIAVSERFKVHTYKRSAGGWTEMPQIVFEDVPVTPNPPKNVTLSANADKLVFNTKTKVYLYSWNGSSWDGSVIKNYEYTGDWSVKFGQISMLSANRNADVVAVSLASVYSSTPKGWDIILEWNGSEWNETHVSLPDYSGYFGQKCVVDPVRQRVVFSKFNNYGIPENPGVVIFEKETGDWVGREIEPLPLSGTFGNAIAISSIGDWLYVGDERYRPGESGALGAVHIVPF